MEIEAAVRALSALAQESRLAVFRTLVRAGPEGVAAGELAERLGIPASTLSFHLQHLTHAGLVSARRSGRSLHYGLRADALRELLWFLGEDCCQGRSDLCAAPAERIALRRREAAEPHGPPPRVLFVCTRNSARSQMAEAILREEAGSHLVVASAGIAPSAVDPLTVRVLQEVGLAREPLRSKDLGEFLGKVPIHHAIIVCEAANAHCPRIVPFALHTHDWPFPDPVQCAGPQRRRLAAFRATRDAIRARIRAWVETRPWEADAPAPLRDAAGDA